MNRPAFTKPRPTAFANIAALLLIAAAGMFATRLSLETATSFINFGAFLAFTVVNVCVISAWLRYRHGNRPMPAWGWVVVPAAGAVVDVYLMTQLSGTAILLGVSWLALGVVYLCAITRGLRQAPPEFRPEAVAEPAGL